MSASESKHTPGPPSAPDLLEALRTLHAYHYPPNVQGLPVNDRIKELDRMARAAIARAAGQGE